MKLVTLKLKTVTSIRNARHQPTWLVWPIQSPHPVKKFLPYGFHWLARGWLSYRGSITAWEVSSRILVMSDKYILNCNTICVKCIILPPSSPRGCHWQLIIILVAERRKVFTWRISDTMMKCNRWPFQIYNRI